MLMFTGGLGTLRPTEFWGALSSLDYRGFRRSDRSGVWIRYPKAAPKQPFHSPKHPKRVKITALLRALSFFFKKQSTFESKNVQKSLCPYGPFHIIQNNFKKKHAKITMPLRTFPFSVNKKNVSNKKHVKKSPCPCGPFHIVWHENILKNVQNHRAPTDLSIFLQKNIICFVQTTSKNHHTLTENKIVSCNKP